MADASKVSYQQQIVNRILGDLQNGTVPWVRGWKASGPSGLGIPYNAASMRSYSGANILVLWHSAMENSYGPGGYLTYRQAKELDGHVRRGEHSTRIFYVGTATKEQENGKEKTFRFLKSYPVFHVSQCDGLPERMHPAPAPALPEPVRHQRAEAFIQAIGADIRYGHNTALYDFVLDRILLPNASQYDHIERFYSSNMHELTHWTGHETRLDRHMASAVLDREKLAHEELVAELGSSFACAYLGIENHLRHSDYIGSWITLLQDRKNALFSAAAKASQAFDYLRARAEPQAIAAE